MNASDIICIFILMAISFFMGCLAMRILWMMEENEKGGRE